MSIVAEFTVQSSEFAFGGAFTEIPESSVELERVVPATDALIPYVWIESDDLDAVERAISEHPAVVSITRLDTVQEAGLYRVTWDDTITDLLDGIAEADGVLLEAYRNGTWFFRLRFPNHDALAQFYNFVTEHEIPLHLERIYTLTERDNGGRQLGLTPEQREALLLALEQGYFDTPSGASLSELGEELGISQQAMSKRIRGGTKRVLTKVLLGSVDDVQRAGR